MVEVADKDPRQISQKAIRRVEQVETAPGDLRASIMESLESEGFGGHEPADD